MPDQKAVIVIGMHRSGTSAISGMLAEMGVFMGKSLFGPQKGVNEKGFYENAKVVAFNEELLDAVISSWDDPLALERQPAIENIPARYFDDARALIHSEYADHRLWGIKDPRSTLLLPFWRRVFAETPDLEPLYIVMLRHPAQVAASLGRRDRFSTSKSLMLWLNYTCLAYEGTISENRLFITYESLCDQPGIHADNISTLLEIEKVADRGVNFVDRSMQRQTDISGSATGHLSTLADEVYLSMSADNPDVERVERAFSQYREFISELHPVCKEHLYAVKEQEVHFRQCFLKAYYSYWWKLAHPIKKLESALRKRERW